jgi:hypothetical protein
MTINIDEIKNDYEKNHKNGDFETLPVGEYDCFVYDMKGGESQKGNPKIDITLKVANGEYQNRNLWTNITLVPQAWWKVQEFFKAIDYDMEQLPKSVETPAEIVDYVFDEVIGIPITAIVTHKKYQGETRENIKKLKACDKELGEDEDTPF